MEKTNKEAAKEKYSLQFNAHRHVRDYSTLT
jgi:hypothetical protein